MLRLPRKSLELIKKYLLRQQKEVEKNLQEVGDDDPATTPSLVETSEPGTDSWVAEEHTKVAVFKASLKNIANSIKEALLQIKRGTYGRCQNCQKPIEISRLLAMPTAKYCLSCSDKR